ncbi:MAG: TfoX/Sxy family protein [Candidatus Thiothrix singaporensis]|uniref:TfoX/Sxy family protein n=1 Tax=Candidatus Thiothrix singaporensis TaxID=2799669 RepID=A0A7L6AXH8_9GAMM|nr:MAG: TfoX/Sxy family protein [Candidatus Thiothrix singaporensis]
MPKPTEYLTYLLELLAPLGQVTHRSMFGGFGIYRDDVIFAIVISDTHGILLSCSIQISGEEDCWCGE